MCNEKEPIGLEQLGIEISKVHPEPGDVIILKYPSYLNPHDLLGSMQQVNVMLPERCTLMLLPQGENPDERFDLYIEKPKGDASVPPKDTPTQD